VGVARVLDPAAHAVRREAFIDAAERLIQAHGYEQMSLQNVLDDLGASRGAFYHYFDSKAALLDATVGRMTERILAACQPLLADTELPAPRKLEALFATIQRCKAARKELVLAVLQVWLSDENAIVREKLRLRTLATVAPLLAEIVRQGVAEGSFTASSPDEAARILLSLLLGSQERAVEQFVARQAGTIPFSDVERTYAAITEAFERILGLPSGSLNLIDEATLREWFG
jgi:AcrR family transcriptional regulator